MQFTTLLFAAAALVGVNAVNLTNTGYVITVGTPFSIGWAGAAGPVTLTLKNGAALDLMTVSTLTSGATSSPFTWNVPSDLPIGNYAIEISDGTSTNYSPDFGLMGATATSSIAVSTTSASSSASASSASVSASASTSSSASVSTSSASVASSSGSMTTSASSSASATSSGNSTTSASKTSSASNTSKTSSSSSSTSSASVPNTNSASEFASPLALVFLTFAAILSLN